MRNVAGKEQGYVLVVVALLLIVLAGFVALGVDTGALFSARTQAQEVADAAALAGAFSYIVNPDPTTYATVATGNALEVALNNTVMGQAIALGDVTVTPDVPNQRVTVVVNSAQPTYFARAIWANTANISVTATAEAAKNSTVSSCVKPWFIPNTIFATGPVCDALCDVTKLLVDHTSDPMNPVITPLAVSMKGQQFTLKPQNPHDAIGPGQFYAIDIPNDANGDDYRNNIESCSSAQVRCSQTYSVLTGNRVGPTKLGVNTLIGNPSLFDYIYPATATEPAHPDFGLFPHKFKRLSDGAKLDIAENVVVAPIWDTCGALGDFCVDGDPDFPNGTMVELRVIGFAIIFLEGIQGDDVVARLINVSACADPDGAGDEGQEGGTVLSFPLRLVRVP